MNVATSGRGSFFYRCKWTVRFANCDSQGKLPAWTLEPVIPIIPHKLHLRQRPQSDWPSLFSRFCSLTPWFSSILSIACQLMCWPNMVATPKFWIHSFVSFNSSRTYQYCLTLNWFYTHENWIQIKVYSIPNSQPWAWVWMIIDEFKMRRSQAQTDVLNPYCCDKPRELGSPRHTITIRNIWHSSPFRILTELERLSVRCDVCFPCSDPFTN